MFVDSKDMAEQTKCEEKFLGIVRNYESMNSMKDQEHKVQHHEWQSKKSQVQDIAQGRILLDFEGAHIHTKRREKRKKKNKESYAKKENMWQYVIIERERVSEWV